MSRADKLRAAGWVTVAEAAELMGVVPETVRRHVRAGRYTTRRYTMGCEGQGKGGAMWIARSEVEEIPQAP